MSNVVPALNRAVPAVPPLLDADRLAAVGRQPAKEASSAVRFGVVGYGYWGPNIVRNLHALQESEVVAVCDKRSDALGRAQRTYPGLRY